MKDPTEGMPGSSIDWESFYRNYRKPGYIAGYEITTKLGGGVFGLVFKARKQSIGKDYAIKFLKVDDDEVRKAVLGELESVKYFAQVDHPNLVSIEDKGEIDGIPFIIMAYAGNETLQSRLKTETDRTRLLFLFLQACRGVQALHERSLVHFDLKPANIFLRGDVARVGDYGLSKMVTCSRNSLSMGRGTPYYMAPEMLRRKGDHRSDIYSLGVILYECLTGDVPFRGSSEWEVLDKHEKQAVAFPADVDPGYRTVIEKCLAKDPADRWPSVKEMVTALRKPAAAHKPFVSPEGTRTEEQAAAAASAKEVVDKVAAERSREIALRAMSRQRRGRQGRFMMVAALVLVAWGMLSFFTVGKMRNARGFSRNVTMSRSAPRAQVTRSTLPVIRERDMQKIGNYEGEPRKLPRLNPPPGTTSRTWDRVEQKLREIARGRDRRGEHADYLKRDSYPALIAALNHLRELDYHDLDDTRQAVRVEAFLKELTHGVAKGIIAPPHGLDERRIQSNCTAVENWFMFFLDFACDRESFRRTLRSRASNR